jgi:hypothetical protein
MFSSFDSPSPSGDPPAPDLAAALQSRAQPCQRPNLRINQSGIPTNLSRSGAGWHPDVATRCWPTGPREAIEPTRLAGVSPPGASRIPGSRHRIHEVVQAPTQLPDSRFVRDARLQARCDLERHRRGVRLSVEFDAHTEGSAPEETLGVEERLARAGPMLELHARKHRCEILGALRHQGMRQWGITLRGSPQIGRTARSRAHRGGGRHVCIIVSRQCVEIVRQSSEMSDGWGGAAWPVSWGSGGPSRGMHPLALSARPGYGPVRRARGAFRPQVPCCLDFAGHHPGVHANQ